MLLERKIGHYGRGQVDAPKAVKAGAITTKGIAPTSEGKESGGESFKISKGKCYWNYTRCRSC